MENNDNNVVKEIKEESKSRVTEFIFVDDKIFISNNEELVTVDLVD